MSGRLVILPKKSWNVWRRDNIARVERDEKAAEEKAAEAQRSRMADRIEEMKGAKAAEVDDVLFDARGHVNFFAREERQAAAAKTDDTRRKPGLFAAPVPLRADEPWYTKERRTGPKTEEEKPKKKKKKNKRRKEDESFASLRRRRLERERVEAARAAKISRSS